MRVDQDTTKRKKDQIRGTLVIVTIGKVITVNRIIVKKKKEEITIKVPDNTRIVGAVTTNEIGSMIINTEVQT